MHYNLASQSWFPIAALLISSTVVFANSTAFGEDATSSDLTAASGTNRFVVWQDSTPGNLDIFVRRSTDDGATWKSAVNLSLNSGNSIEPQIAVAGANVYVAWIQKNSAGTVSDIYVRSSPDNGATWGSKVKISSTGTSDSIPELGASSSNVYVMWADAATKDVHFRRSIDSGATWQSVVNLSSNAGVSNSVQMSVSGNSVYSVWTQLNSAGTLSDILFRASTDGGASWGAKIKLSNTGTARGPQITSNAANVNVVWIDGSSADIFQRRSTDSGATWKAVKNLTNSSTDGYVPLITSSGSAVYLAYIEVNDYGEGADIEMYLRRSTDNGATWAARVLITSGAEDGYHWLDDIKASGSNVYVLAEYESGHGCGCGDSFSVFYSTNGGVNWSGNGEDGTDYDIDTYGFAVSGAKVFVFYSQTNGSNYDIKYVKSTDGGATYKSPVKLSSNSGYSGNPKGAL